MTAIVYTWDILRVTRVDSGTFTITFVDASRPAEQTVGMGPVPDEPLTQQLFEACVASIAVNGGSWQSTTTLSKAVRQAGHLSWWLCAEGVRDFSEDGLQLATLRRALEEFDTPGKRTLNKLLGRVLRSHNPRGSTLAQALANTKYMVVPGTTEPYPDETADAIRASARGVFYELLERQRKVLEDLGVKVHGRAWLRLSAEEVEAVVRQRWGHLEDAPVPKRNATTAELSAWVLLNAGSQAEPWRWRDDLAALEAALFPTDAALTAALILHCFADDTGLNRSVMLRTAVNDLVYTGDENAVLELVKARNHTVDRIPTFIYADTTLGGLIEMLVGLTRFSRLYRRRRLKGPDGTVHPSADRLYALHRRQAERIRTLDQSEITGAWRSAAFTRHWPADAPARDQVGLRFAALRLKVLERQIKKGPGGDVHGHTRRTRVHYLQHVLPDRSLAAHLARGQDAMLQAADAAFRSTKRVGAALDGGDVVDLGVTTCTNAGQDPDDTSQPCSLGLAACFTCECGWRTADNVPGLIALRDYTLERGAIDVAEWIEGEAGLLHTFAVETLERFPRLIVDRAEAEADLDLLKAIVHSLYTEIRR